MTDGLVTSGLCPERPQVVVIGSGAGGAVTAAQLAQHGYEVVVLEEGPAIDTSTIATNSPDALLRLYRNGGLTPFLGNQSIAYVEGCVVGGSTEVNSGFWHRLPADCYDRWRSDALLADCTEADLTPYFEVLERELAVSKLGDAPLPRSSQRFHDGITRLGWRFGEVPRCQPDATTNAFAPNAKRSMQRSFLPKAVAHGARVFANHRVARLIVDADRVAAIEVRLADGSVRTLRPDAVFVCAGAIQTAALLRRSGLTHNVGNNLCIHPMIKAAAVFADDVDAQDEPLPIFQVREFAPNISIGGSVFTPGFLAMLLADNWGETQQTMRDWKRSAIYYAATRGMSRGTIRPWPGAANGVLVRYRLTAADQKNLSEGLARLGELLFAAGATRVHPSVRGLPTLRSPEQCRALATNWLPVRTMSLSTVHAFSSCPMGENPDLCATDSFGRVRGVPNLYVNDASLIPDSPGVNPQGTVMALALRNADRFAATQRRSTASRKATVPPTLLLTGAPGWLGNRLLEVLYRGLPEDERFASPDLSRRVRLLAQTGADIAGLRDAYPDLDIVTGDVADPDTARALCADARGATLIHIAGLIHPQRRTSELVRTNVTGTRTLLDAAAAAGVARVVAMSSNSPFGFNRGNAERFDESSPYHPYMAYGRSKRAMEEHVREAHALGRLKTVIIRAPWFYGPHQPARQTLFFEMIRTGKFPVLGDGEQRRSMAYVDNICQGLLLAASVRDAAGHTYWIADERPYAINEIVSVVSRVLEQELGRASASRQLHLPRALGDVARVVDATIQSFGLYQQKIHVLSEMGQTIACSVQAARRDLGYRPTIALEEGMRRSVRWCLAHGQLY